MILKRSVYLLFAPSKVVFIRLQSIYRTNYNFNGVFTTAYFMTGIARLEYRCFHAGSFKSVNEIQCY